MSISAFTRAYVTGTSEKLGYTYTCTVVPGYRKSTCSMSPRPLTVFWKDGFFIITVIRIEDAASVSSFVCTCVGAS